MNNNEDLVDAVVTWMIFIQILLGTCILGLTLTLIKGILNYFGISNPL